ncbi:hypothetical protein B0H15DRAFT_958329 [Mycena belliarum]|uniref:Uncharacterized protein n=1 Tax=Mycena belliarum TaxID=1033014 RepID=A0AAD6TL56_9AGAR|nr:hypothetical protein B0H15DRAFT_958329 [Mycena belliae]
MRNGNPIRPRRFRVVPKASWSFYYDLVSLSSADGYAVSSECPSSALYFARAQHAGGRYFNSPARASLDWGAQMPQACSQHANLSAGANNPPRSFTPKGMMRVDVELAALAARASVRAQAESTIHMSFERLRGNNNLSVSYVDDVELLESTTSRRIVYYDSSSSTCCRLHLPPWALRRSQSALRAVFLHARRMLRAPCHTYTTGSSHALESRSEAEPAVDGSGATIWD